MLREIILIQTFVNMKFLIFFLMYAINSNIKVVTTHNTEIDFNQNIIETFSSDNSLQYYFLDDKKRLLLSNKTNEYTTTDMSNDASRKNLKNLYIGGGVVLTIPSILLSLYFCFKKKRKNKLKANVEKVENNIKIDRLQSSSFGGYNLKTKGLAFPNSIEKKQTLESGENENSQINIEFFNSKLPLSVSTSPKYGEYKAHQNSAIHTHETEGRESIVEDLVSSMKSNDSGFGRQTTLELLSNFSDQQNNTLKIFDTLIDCLFNDEYGENREKAASSLAKLGNKNAIGPLKKALENEKDNDVKGSIIEALGVLKAEDMLENIVNLTKKYNDKAVRQGAILALGYFDENISRNTLLSLIKEQNSDFIISNIIISLGRLRVSQAYSFVSKHAFSNSETVQKNAVLALGDIKNLRGIEILDKVLRNSSSEAVRKNAVVALGRIQHSKGVSVLSYVLENDSSSNVKVLAVKSLGKIGTQESKLILQPFTKMNNELGEQAKKAINKISKKQNKANTPMF